MAGAATPCLLVLLLSVTLHSASAFKQSDFKTCAQAAFCQRTRGVANGQQFEVVANSVAVDGGALTATLVNTHYNNQLQLILAPHADGFFRLTVDESPSVDRYQVPREVLADGWDQKKAAFTESGKDANGFAVTLGDASVTLTYKPFKLTIKVKGQPALIINDKNLFNFEHRRQKQDGDPAGWWEETFNNHPDTKPKGPEAMSLDISFPGFDHVYGLPERASALSLQQTGGSGRYSEPYRLYNLDVFEYLDDSPFGLYGNIPFMSAHRAGLTIGVLWLNAAEMFVDVAKSRHGTSTQWITESGIVELFIFLGPSPADVVKQNAKVTGTSALPQLFSLGYHQCRWNYKDEADVKQVDAGFDTHEIPYDVLWLDIEHTNGKRYFTWDSSLFPNPIPMQEDVASRGRKMVTIVDPHVKRDHGYYLFADAEKHGYYVKNRQNNDFDGWCWPGSSSYLDVTSPVVREWWATQFGLDKYQGSTKHLYIWNDMNEPSVFNGPEITMPKDNLHYMDVEHRDVHNLFGMFYHMGSADGLRERGFKTEGSDGDRPFVLSRAFFSGTQRVGPIWTGDNSATWSHLKVSVPMVMTLGLAGLPNTGADVGGFFGNPDAELLTRWYQLGVFYPFFRGHAHLETQRREPWLFGPETTARIRHAIRARYALLPYIYTLFREANITGMPLMRPLWFEFPENKDTFAIDEEFLLGAGLLVRPVVSAGAPSVDTFLPSGSRWYNTLTGVEMPTRSQSHRVPVNIEGIPSFYRGGHIIPRRERPRRSSATMGTDPYTLVVALDSKGEAAGTLYADDGHSFAFKRGSYMHRQFTFKANRLECTKYVEVGVPDQKLTQPTVIERVVFLGLPAGKKYKAKIGGVHVVDLEAGPLSMHSAHTVNAYVLRKPDLPVSQDWYVEIGPV